MSDGPFCAHSIVRSVPHIDPVGNRSDHWRCECGQVFEPIPGGPDLIDEIIEASSPGFDALVDAATARRTADEHARLRGHMRWIARQFCERTSDADVRVCPSSGDCLTEWCLSCYAKAALEEKP